MVNPIGLIIFGTVYLDNSRDRIGPWVIAAIGAGTRGLTLPLTLYTGPNTRYLQRNVRWECYKYETVK